jgi:N-dimethylarginine dimethylaminohydrolase
MVNSYTEWGDLKEVILGRAENAQIPNIKNKDIHCVDYADYEEVRDLPGGLYPERIIEETIEDLNDFQKILESLNIKVLRPEILDFKMISKIPEWESDGYYSYCPRDSTLIIGDCIIETPMPLRSRYFENFAYKKIFQDYFLNGSKWISAPKGSLTDDLYDRTNLKKPTLMNTEPAFDAANVVRCGKDIFYLVSNSGNHLGAMWLRSVLGEKYNIHIIDNVYAYVHLDTTILPLAPGKVLMNPSRIKEENIPDYFRKWKIIWAEEPIPTEYQKDWAPASPWLGINILSINPSTVVVEQTQIPLMRQLEKEGFTVIPVRLRHSRTLSGGPHCITLDTVRKDYYDDYS